MARLRHVKSARKSATKRTCRRCGKKIKEGDSYFWFANRLGRSSIRKEYCADHHPRPSEMTTSDKLSSLYGAQESVQDVLDTAQDMGEGDWETYRDDVAAALEDALSVADDVGSQYRESKENMPQGFQEGETGQMCEERADACEQWRAELENAAAEVQNYDPDEGMTHEAILEAIAGIASAANDGLEL